MSLKGNVIANYMGQGWTAIMGLAFVPLYIQALGIESYGLIGVFAILQAWMSILDLGLTPTLNREMARQRAGGHSNESIRDLLRSLEFVYLGLTLLMVAAVWLAAPWLAGEWLQTGQLPQAGVVTALRIMGVVLAARAFEQIYRGSLQGLQDQVWLNGAQAFIATLRWAGAWVIVAFLWPTVTAFFIWQGLVALLGIAILVTRTYWILPTASRAAHFSLAALRGIKAYASGMFASSVLSLILTQADKVIISRLLPIDQLGFYMLAATAAGGLLQLIVPMNAALFPRLTEQVEREDIVGLAATYHRACEWMAAIIVPPALVLTFFSEPVLLLWTGNSNLASTTALLLGLLSSGTLCNGLMNLPYMLQLAHGWTALSVKVNLVAVAIIVPAIIWAVPRWGATGAAAVWLALNAGYLVFSAHLMYRRLLPAAKWRWYRNAVALPVGGGSLVAAALAAALPLATSRLDAALSVTLAVTVLSLTVMALLPDVRQRLLNAWPGLRWG
jgi:O-antigen/teichoic acid export membrane protein